MTGKYNIHKTGAAGDMEVSSRLSQDRDVKNDVSRQDTRLVAPSVTAAI